MWGMKEKYEMVAGPYRYWVLFTIMSHNGIYITILVSNCENHKTSLPTPTYTRVHQVANQIISWP